MSEDQILHRGCSSKLKSVVSFVPGDSDWLKYIYVIYKALRFDVAQGRMNRAPNEWLKYIYQSLHFLHFFPWVS